MGTGARHRPPCCPSRPRQPSCSSFDSFDLSGAYTRHVWVIWCSGTEEVVRRSLRSSQLKTTFALEPPLRPSSVTILSTSNGYCISFCLGSFGGVSRKSISGRSRGGVPWRAPSDGSCRSSSRSVVVSGPGVRWMGRRDRFRSHSVNTTESLCTIRRSFAQSDVCGSM